MISRHFLVFASGACVSMFFAGCADVAGDALDATVRLPDATATADSSVIDTGPRDLGVADSGDAGAGDSGAPDGGSLDAATADTGTTATTVVDVDFETRVPPFVNVGTATLTPSQGYAPLGHPGNTFGPTFLRSLTGNLIIATISPLPPHTSISLDFLFAAIDSLDGEGTFPAGDYFRIDLDGTTIFREAFANATPAQIQTYNPPVPEIVLARHVDLGFSGPGGFYTDSAYDMSLDPTFHNLPHTASSAVFLFTLEGAGVQSLDDESWAIDNLRVTTR